MAKDQVGSWGWDERIRHGEGLVYFDSGGGEDLSSILWRFRGENSQLVRRRVSDSCSDAGLAYCCCRRCMRLLTIVSTAPMSGG